MQVINLNKRIKITLTGYVPQSRHHSQCWIILRNYIDLEECLR